jgi:hypothetical protein|tara:strand:- start:6806 stop:7057 length:252 start_codon:yes stop_codon:yes gene_type:complete
LLDKYRELTKRVHQLSLDEAECKIELETAQGDKDSVELELQRKCYEMAEFWAVSPSASRSSGISPMTANCTAVIVMTGRIALR